MFNNDQVAFSALARERQAQGPLTALEAALTTALRSITAYNGWLILEYSELVEGKLSPRFSVQHPPGGPIQAGKSLKEAKQAIDGGPKSRPKGSR